MNQERDNKMSLIVTIFLHPDSGINILDAQRLVSSQGPIRFHVSSVPLKAPPPI